MELPILIRGGWLWWLLALLPLLWWLALPPRPRRSLWTPHRAQWLFAQAALRRRPPRFRALRWLLLSLATVAAMLAVAGASTNGGGGPRRLVVLLDASASMGQRIGADTAFALACERLRRELRAVPDDIEVAVCALRDGAVTRWSGPAARALVAPGAPSGLLPAPLGELAAAASGEPDTAVLVVGDAGVGELPAAVAYAPIGGEAPNFAVVGLRADDRWPAATLPLAFELRSHAFEPATGTVTIDGAVVSSRTLPVALAPGERRWFEVEVERQRAGGLVRVQAQFGGDALASDDVASVMVPPLPLPRVAVRTDDGDPIGAAFARAAARALAEAVGAEVVAAAAGAAAGFLLAEGGIATLAPGSAPMALFGVAPASGGAVWPAPVVVDWARDEPLLAGLDLSELRIDHALRAGLPAGQPLLLGALPDGSTAPLAVWVEGEQAGSLHTAFRLQDSNLGLLPAFPQLLLRAFRRGHGGGAALAVAPLPPAAESDLRQPPAAPRPLPPWRPGGRDLGPQCLLVALALLVLRSAVP